MLQSDQAVLECVSMPRTRLSPAAMSGCRFDRRPGMMVARINASAPLAAGHDHLGMAWGTGMNRRRAGFTLMELMIVVTIIIALAAMGFPAWSYIRKNANINATRGLVQAVALSITSYGTRYWEVNWVDSLGKSKKRMCRLWDMNYASPPVPSFNDADPTPGDGILDGRPSSDVSSSLTPDDPEKYDGYFWKELVRSGYTGFIGMTLPAISKKNIDKRHRVIDPWGQPLHIAYGAEIYGPAGFGIWSLGPDKKDGVIAGVDFSVDNICSWTSAND
jgi:prepilin-type N-terminal cleavage/methylation domain-containing protein